MASPAPRPVARTSGRGGVPPQNLVQRAIVDVSTLGAKLAYPDASLAVRPARDRQIEPEAADRLLTNAPSCPEYFADVHMPLYGRYRFVKREKLDFAGDLIFVLPTDTAFALEVALPFRIKPNDRLSVDTGVEVRGTFGSSKRADIRIPAIVNYNFSDRAFIAGETGVQFVNLGKGFNTAADDTQGVAIPIDFRAGGTWKKVDKHLIDLFAGFAFPQLFEFGTSRSTVDFGIWDIFVGVAFYTRPLF